jgi:hypothetical protein
MQAKNCIHSNKIHIDKKKKKKKKKTFLAHCTGPYFLMDRSGLYFFIDRTRPQFLADRTWSGPTEPHKKFDPVPERFLDHTNPDSPRPDCFVAQTCSDWTYTQNVMTGSGPCSKKLKVLSEGSVSVCYWKNQQKLFQPEN